MCEEKVYEALRRNHCCDHGNYRRMCDDENGSFRCNATSDDGSFCNGDEALQCDAECDQKCKVINLYPCALALMRMEENQSSSFLNVCIVLESCGHLSCVESPCVSSPGSSHICWI